MSTWNNEILDYIFTINYKHIDINVKQIKQHSRFNRSLSIIMYN